jgi:hypothetical protein
MQGLRTSALLFVFVLGGYAANGRLIGSVDTVANQLLPIAIVRGDGLALNRFEETVRDQYYVKADGERLRSRYPIMPALVALPLTWLQVHALDRMRPGWTRDPAAYESWIRAIARLRSSLR